jgi:predicted amidohydrolase YtcJ
MTLPTHADKSTTAPDLIIVNAVIHTMDPNQPTAEAVAIYRNRIMAVGSTKEIRKLAATNTRVIDAKKRLVLPGFNDAHTHFMNGGFQLSSVDLRSSNSPKIRRTNSSLRREVAERTLDKRRRLGSRTLARCEVTHQRAHR